MVLVHTCGSALRGKDRNRIWLKNVDGVMHRRKYTLRQPDVHARYRGKFWMVDAWNHSGWGPKSCKTAFNTKDWRIRTFLAALGACVNNAYMVYNDRREASGMGKVKNEIFKR